jgi:NADP+-dependent farnesol dehydrogenase
MERWSGRVAVVAGATRGIGAAIAAELTKKGLKVIGLARRVERMEVSVQRNGKG